MGAESWSNDIAMACNWYDTKNSASDGSAGSTISANGGLAEDSAMVWESDDDSDYGLMQFSTESIGNAAAITMTDGGVASLDACLALKDGETNIGIF
jgi:hypothetical protein